MKPKLVRDKIPELMASEGFMVTFHTLSDEEYKQALLDKLDEEVAEFHLSRKIEELADIMEVIHSLASILHDKTIMDVEMIRCEKRRNRGGFDKKYFIEEVRSKSDGR